MLKVINNIIAKLFEVKYTPSPVEVKIIKPEKYVDNRCICEIGEARRMKHFDQFCADFEDDIAHYNSDSSLEYLGKGRVVCLGGCWNIVGWYRPGVSTFIDMREYHFWKLVN